jgi:hypothetical protein
MSSFVFTVLNRDVSPVNFCIGPTSFVFWGKSEIKSGPIQMDDRYFCTKELFLGSEETFSWEESPDMLLSNAGSALLIANTILLDPRHCDSSYGCSYDTVESRLDIEVNKN